jgi:hypothetical protein
VVHGHFYIEKYRCLRAARVTILRHPVDRLISHYLFWNHQPAHGHSLHDQFLSEQPSIVQFARMPFLRHFYRQVLFRDVDMGMFDLIGNTENMDESVSQMEKVTGRKLWLETTNANTCKHCRKQRAKILKKESVLAELRDILADDIAFYERHARPG